MNVFDQIVFATPGEYMVSFYITGTGITAITSLGVGQGITVQAILAPSIQGSAIVTSTFYVVVTIPNATQSIAVTATTVTSAFAAVGSVPLGSLN
jgi:hypothetical protein